MLERENDFTIRVREGSVQGMLVFLLENLMYVVLTGEIPPTPNDME